MKLPPKRRTWVFTEVLTLPANPVVLCDANVLYGQWLRDLIMNLAVAALIQPRWSERIEQEWLENLLAHRPDLDPKRVRRTAAAMNQVLPGAKVTSPAQNVNFALPDPDDVHVLQTALSAGAAYLLTFNLADFPAEVCSGIGIEVIHPETFLLRLYAAEPAGVTGAILHMQRQKVRPPISWSELAQALERTGLPRFSRLLLEAPHP